MSKHLCLFLYTRFAFRGVARNDKGAKTAVEEVPRQAKTSKTKNNGDALFFQFYQLPIPLMLSLSRNKRREKEKDPSTPSNLLFPVPRNHSLIFQEISRDKGATEQSQTTK